MRHGTRLIISASVLVIMIGAVSFLEKPEPSAAQNLEGFKLYQLNVHCSDTSLVSKIFTHSVDSGGTEGRPLMGTLVHCVGKCGGNTGPVTLEAALAGLPVQVATALQAKVDEYQGNATPAKLLDCVGEPKSPPKCKIPSEGTEDGPWNRTDCKSFQDVLFRRTTRGVLEISACGHIIGRAANVAARFVETARAAWPNKICCDRLSGPRNTPCDYSQDVDCDGTPNAQDGAVPSNYDGERSFYRIPEGTRYDPPPDGLRLSQLLPDVAACDGCKWDLVKGSLKCEAKTSETGLFWYEATWKCPKTGVEVWMTSKQRLLQQKCNSKT